MVMTDPIADMLTRIRNAQQMKKSTVNIPHSKIKVEIADLMQAKGFIASAEQVGEGINKEIVITLKYNNKQPVIHGIKRISKPGLRIYAKASDVPKVLNGLGLAIVSTSQGILTDHEARERGVGGEVIAYIW